MRLTIAAGMEPVAGYKIVRKLGQGGFGEVWEAEAPGGVRVAMKFIRLNTAQSQPELRALEIIRNIRHPHLLDVQFSVILEDVVLIAMPLCDQSLWDRLNECIDQGKPGIPRGELLGYMEELAKAVDFLNEPRHLTPDGQRIGIQHRDIKPHNIFLVGGCVRLADFGLAKFLSSNLASHTGSMSPNYVAPEALKGTVAHQSDQYALGITYYQLRTQKLAIGGHSIDQIIYNHLHGDPDLSAIPAEERPAVARALAKEPVDRWPTCSAFVTQLKHAIANGPGEESEITRQHDNPVHPTQTPSQHSQPIPPSLQAEWNRHLDLATQLGSGTVPAVGFGPSSTSSAPFTPNFEVPQCGVNPAFSKERSFSEAQPPTQRPDERRPRRWSILAGGVGLLLAVVAGALAWKQGNSTNDVGKPQPSPTPHSFATDPTTKSSATRTTTVTATPRILRFEPPTVKVLLDGKPQVPDENGQVTLDPAGEGSFTVVAEAEGHQTYRKTMRYADLETSNERILLEPVVHSTEELAVRARGILRAHCFGCHGVAFQVPGLDVLDRDSLVAPLSTDRPPVVVPGNADQSALWQVLGSDSHGGVLPKDRSSALERTILRHWIEAGAPKPNVERRPAHSEQDLLTSIRDHLKQMPEDDRQHQRYFTFTYLYNNPEITTEELGLYRAAFAKLINSLSWQPDVVGPLAIDDDQLIFCLDLRRLGWEKDHIWDDILAPYTYGLKHPDDQNPLHALEEEIVELNGEDLPYLRADWFVASASRPPLYHQILRLPETAPVLEAKLGVEFGPNFLRSHPARAGYSRSAVSGQNQVAERRHGTFGAYWKTYDFQPGNPKGDIFRFPLGPNFAENPYSELAFSPAGSLILFHLPNGLLASMIVDADGRRLDAAPTELAHDPLHSAGTSTLGNGLSCLSCHREGLIPIKDEVRQGTQVTGQALAEVKSLYLVPSALEASRKEDELKFLAAVDKATREFLKDRTGAASNHRDLPEPIQAIARRFGKPLSVNEVAIELGMTAVESIPICIKRTPRLLKLGLEPLVHGKRISRETWNNAFGQLAIELNVGAPHLSN